jgi:cytosine/adenosine deaminase-related metal-dependent hydrolase
MSPPAVRVLPTEVELAIELQPCLAERRTYEAAEQAHPCEFFADQGSFHSFDLRDGGPPLTRGVLQKAQYAGRRRVSPEMLSGCRKAPIMAVGINPNLPVFWPGKHNSLLPRFDDVLQYAHHYRYRAVGKLQIPRADYDALRGGRADDPSAGTPLCAEGTELPVELADQAMYLAYQSLLDGLAHGMGWSDARLSVGEDLSYGNMVACGSPRWITKPDPALPRLPVMSPQQQRGIVQECFVERRYFLRQLFQSLPSVLLVFSAATRDAFIRAMSGHFSEGAPQVGEDLERLLDRRIVLRYGEVGGRTLRARVLFIPHASGNAAAFAAVRKKAVAALVAEANAGELVLQPDGHLRRPAGGCTFCDNALYRIGPCDYEQQLALLAGPLEESAQPGQEPAPDALRERRVQETLLSDFLAQPGVREESAEAGSEEAASGGAPQHHVLLGRVVTMRPDFAVLPRAAVYVSDGLIEAVREPSAPAPEGYADARRVETRGTIYPGLIDLHNHLAYNVLPPWPVPIRYGDRSRWRRARAYGAKVRLMRRLARGEPAMAVARYVEVKALLGGVTALQGMRSSFKPVSGAMRGLVRNVEHGGPRMPGAGSGVIDLDVTRPEEIERFRNAVHGESAAYFYHLSEGVNEAARKCWDDLVQHELIGPSLAGIHCLGIPAAGLKQLADAKAAVVWSPTSNLMLYGETLRLRTLLASKVRWALGCDWSPTGGKNPLFELKVARAVAAAQGVALRARELVAAVTSHAAAAVRWQDAVGKIAPGFHADLLVLEGDGADPYEQLIAATEADVSLVMVDGVARAGTAELFDAAGVPESGRESVAVGEQVRQLWLQEPGTPLHGFTLARAQALLDQRMTAETVEEEEAFDPAGDFELVLDDEMAPLPPEAGEEAEEAGAEDVLLQKPDALTVLDDAALWSALEAIEHFGLSVAELRDYYR